jgi:hypothetical protein
VTLGDGASDTNITEIDPVSVGGQKEERGDGLFEDLVKTLSLQRSYQK